jgi:hypothetical protein
MSALATALFVTADKGLAGERITHEESCPK